MKIKKLQVNSDFVAGHKKGEIISIHVDSNNVPTNPFWRQRVKDAQTDNCCEFIKEKANESKKNKSREVKADDR